MVSSVRRCCSEIDRWIQTLCGGAVVLCVTAMLVLALLGIVLRWCGMSLLWIDPMVRHLVFLATFLGGVLAIGKNSHIAIDLLGKRLQLQGERTGQWWWYRLHKKFIFLVCSLGVSWLTWASWPFILSEWEYGRPGFSASTADF